MRHIFLSGHKKTETGLSSKHSNGGSLDRYTADPNQRAVQGVDIIRPKPTPCKLQIPHQQFHQTNSPIKSACVYFMLLFSFTFVGSTVRTIRDAKIEFCFMSSPTFCYVVQPFSIKYYEQSLFCLKFLFYQKTETISFTIN